MTSQPAHHPASEFAALREDLADLAGLVLAQVERAIAGWDASDETVVESVEATDREVDMRSAALEERILELHRNWSAFAGDLRLLHVGLITAVALERVGNLAVAISRLAGSVPPPEPELDEVRRIIREMGERAVDALAGAVQAVARGDLEAGDRAVGTAPSGSRSRSTRCSTGCSPRSPGRPAAPVCGPGRPPRCWSRGTSSAWRTTPPSWAAGCTSWSPGRSAGRPRSEGRGRLPHGPLSERPCRAVSFRPRIVAGWESGSLSTESR